MSSEVRGWAAICTRLTYQGPPPPRKVAPRKLFKIRHMLAFSGEFRLLAYYHARVFDEVCLLVR